MRFRCKTCKIKAFWICNPDWGKMCHFQLISWIHICLVQSAMYRCHRHSQHWLVGCRRSSMVRGFQMTRCSGLKNLPQSEKDGWEALDAPDGSFCSPLSCDCDCFLCMETFCGWRTHYRAADAAGVRWPVAPVSVCCWSFFLRGRLVLRRQSHRQRWDPRCQKKALLPIRHPIWGNLGHLGHLRTHSGSPVARPWSPPPADCLHWHRSNFPAMKMRHEKVVKSGQINYSKTCHDLKCLFDNTFW